MAAFSFGITGSKLFWIVLMSTMVRLLFYRTHSVVMSTFTLLMWLAGQCNSAQPLSVNLFETTR